MRFTQLLFTTLSAFILSAMTSIMPTMQSTLQAQIQQNSQNTTPRVQLATAQNQQESRNWSGYAASHGTFTGVQATWKVAPNNAPNNYGIDATWVGIGGVDTNDLIQSGTQQTVDRSGNVSYEAFYETLPDISQPVDISINPGDSISASVTEQKNNNWQILIRNNTTGQSVSVHKNYHSSLSSADWIEEAPSGMRRILPLDNFGTVEFQNATAIENGQRVTLLESNAQPIAMSNDLGQTLAKASIVSKNGTMFAVSRTDTSSITSAGQDAYANIQSVGQGIPFIVRRITYYYFR